MRDINKHNQKILDQLIIPSKVPDICNSMIGNTYGRLYIESYAGYRKKGYGKCHYVWCKCECGNYILIDAKSIREGKSTSCGCFRSEYLKDSHTKHGDADNCRLYNIWKGMKGRCFTPSNNVYKHYGGRGITVCKEWRDPDTGYLNFKQWALNNGYTDKLSIDRIDSNGNYCPENCRWVGYKIQENNTSRNVYYQYDRYVFTVAIWSDITGIDYHTLVSRLKRDISIHDALCTPVGYQPGEKSQVIYVPPEMEIYNKYDEWVKTGKIKPIEDFRP